MPMSVSRVYRYAVVSPGRWQKARSAFCMNFLPQWAVTRTEWMLIKSRVVCIYRGGNNKRELDLPCSHHLLP